MIHLTIIESKCEVRSQTLSDHATRIGRTLNNELVIRNQFISGLHGEIRKDGEKFIYQDMGSTNGSRVRRNRWILPVDQSNGHEVELQDGDEIHLGDASAPVCLRVAIVADSTIKRSAAAGRRSHSTIASNAAETFNREALVILHELSMTMNEGQTPRALVSSLADGVLKMFKAASCVSVYLQDVRGQRARGVLARTREEDVEPRPLDGAIRERVLSKGKGVAFAFTDSGGPPGLCAPLWSGDELVGFIQAERVDGVFDERDLEIFEVIAHVGATAIDAMHQARANKAAVESSIQGLLTSLAGRDEWLGANSQFVAELSRTMGEQIGLAESELWTIERAGLYHDLGKLVLPDAALRTANGEGEAPSRTHSELGERMLRPFGQLEDVAAIVRSHHERHDGTGFPDALVGNAIPLGARILAVADSHHRNLTGVGDSRSMSAEDSLANLMERAGTEFDPSIVEVLAGVLEGKDTENFDGESTVVGGLKMPPKPELLEV